MSCILELAMTKDWGRRVSGLWTTIRFGPYAQYFPKTFEGARHDPRALRFSYKWSALLGLGEIVLPFLIVIGFVDALSIVGMIGLRAGGKSWVRCKSATTFKRRWGSAR